MEELEGSEGGIEPVVLCPAAAAAGPPAVVVPAVAVVGVTAAAAAPAAAAVAVPVGTFVFWSSGLVLSADAADSEASLLPEALNNSRSVWTCCTKSKFCRARFSNLRALPSGLSFVRLSSWELESGPWNKT